MLLPREKVSPLAVIAEAEDGVGEAELGKDENYGRDVQRKLVLLVNGASYGRDCVRRAE